MQSLSYNIGDRIRYFREKAGLTQKQLGELTGISEPAIRNYELGNRTPGWETLVNLSEALKVSYYALDAGAADRTFKVIHMLFEMEDLYGLMPFTDENGETYFKFGFDLGAYRKIAEKYDSSDPSEFTEDDQAEVERICGNVSSPGSALNLDDVFYTWALVRKAMEEGKLDEQAYIDWKYKYPVHANVDEDGNPEIYD